MDTRVACLSSHLFVIHGTCYIRNVFRIAGLTRLTFHVVAMESFVTTYVTSKFVGETAQLP